MGIWEVKLCVALGQEKVPFLRVLPQGFSIQKLNKMGLGNIVLSGELVWCPEEADPQLAKTCYPSVVGPLCHKDPAWTKQQCLVG